MKLLAWLLAGLVINAAALWIAVEIVPSAEFDGSFGDLLIVALLFGLVNVLVRPIARLLTLPLSIMTLGLFTLVLNGAIAPDHGFRDVLIDAPQTTEPIRDVLRTLDHERQRRGLAGRTIADALGRAHPKLPQVRLPYVERAEPRGIVEALALAFDAELPRLGLG